MKGEKGARTDRRAARLRWFGSKNLPSVLFILPIFLCLSSFLFFFFPLFVLVELICSVHVTKIRPLHVCLSPILPSLPRDYWPEQPVQKVAVVGLIPIPLCGTRMEKNNPTQTRPENRKCRNANFSGGPKRGYVRIPRDSKDMHGRGGFTLSFWPTRHVWQKNKVPFICARGGFKVSN